MATCLTSNEVCNVDCVCRNIGIGVSDLGSTVCGGILIHKYGGGSALIVAPYTTQIIRRWYERADAVTCAEDITGTSGWYIPSFTELELVGANKNFLDACGAYYWSDNLHLSSGNEPPLEQGMTWRICSDCNICVCVRICCSTLVTARAVKRVYY